MAREDVFPYCRGGSRVCPGPHTGTRQGSSQLIGWWAKPQMPRGKPEQAGSGSDCLPTHSVQSETSWSSIQGRGKNILTSPRLAKKGPRSLQAGIMQVFGYNSMLVPLGRWQGGGGLACSCWLNQLPFGQLAESLNTYFVPDSLRLLHVKQSIQNVQQYQVKYILKVRKANYVV